MKNKIANLICERLRAEAEKYQGQFQGKRNDISTRYFIVDNLLPDDLALAIYHSFPPVSEMRLMSSFREKKYTSKNLDKFAQLVSDATFAFQTSAVIAEIERICGFNELRANQSLYAGGISAMTKNQFLNPHIDNSHDSERQLYRALNILYYVTPKWQKDFGGNLELWDTKVRKCLEIPSLFNRLVVMETNRWSYHSVNRVVNDGVRCCVSNYYFQKSSLESKDYFHITAFVARPEQPVLRLLSKVDNATRTFVRQIFTEGIGTKDVYKKSRDEVN